MSIFEWAALGALILVALIYSARMMRRGLTTLDQDRSEYMARLAAGERQLAEDCKRISAEEQLYMMRAALEDFLRLENGGENESVQARGRILRISGSGRVFEVELRMRERLLASTQKVLHGRGQWLLRGPGVDEEHNGMAELMASLNRHWHGFEAWDQEPEHVSRRLAASRRGRR